ncbi:type VI secretion system tip protein VgrG [Emticicia sp. 17c]|uniref:type VI secretion system tip protein VgrG n=1 Tax=Emticicia sp. 17c TaxID=3127704 RepID=UPI00301C4297
MADSSSPSFKVKANGEVVSHPILSVIVNKTINQLAYARILIADGESSQAKFEISNTADFEPGSKIEILAGNGGNDQTIFKGIVVKHSVKLTKTQTTLLFVECKDEAVKMTKVRQSKYFKDVKDSDVIEEIIGPYNLQKEVSATNVTHKELFQYQITDWDFMVCRAEANGFLIATDDAKVIMKKPDFSPEPALTLTFGDNLKEFDAELNAHHQFETVKAESWNESDQKLEEVEAGVPSSVVQIGNLTTATLADKTGKNTDTIRHSGNLKSEVLQAWADAQQLKNTLSKIQGTAKANGNALLKPFAIVRFEGLSNRFNGKAFVSGIRHELSQGNWSTDIQFGLPAEWFAAEKDINPLPASGLFSAIQGLQIGVVVDIEEDSNNPESKNRVLVKLPVADNQAQGIWARQSMLDAGNKRGSFFRPYKDDEVILGFINNDPNEAVILGMLHSNKNVPPHKPDKDNYQRGFVTKEETKIWFDDEKKELEILTKAGNSVKLSEDKKGITLKDQNGNEIVMDDSGIKIKSIKDITIEASNSLTGKGNTVEVNGQSSLTAKGGSSAEFSSGGNTTLKGSMVMIN